MMTRKSPPPPLLLLPDAKGARRDIDAAGENLAGMVLPFNSFATRRARFNRRESSEYGAYQDYVARTFGDAFRCGV
jgi:hypothetical protein